MHTPHLLDGFHCDTPDLALVFPEDLEGFVVFSNEKLGLASPVVGHLDQPTFPVLMMRLQFLAATRHGGACLSKFRLEVSLLVFKEVNLSMQLGESLLRKGIKLLVQDLILFGRLLS